MQVTMYMSRSKTSLACQASLPNLSEAACLIYFCVCLASRSRDSLSTPAHLTTGALALQMCAAVAAAAAASHRFQGFNLNSSLLHGKHFIH